jgi:5-methylcytosine-specific restriction protein B
MPEGLKERVVGWFRRINSYAQRNPAASVGHAYFWDVYDAESLRSLWEYQLKHLVERAFRRDETTRNELGAAWEQIFQPDSASNLSES